MTMTFKYKSVGTTAFNVDLGSSAVRLASIQGFSERAEHAAVGSSQVIIDNPLGTVGYASDQIIGLQLFTVDESDCPAGNQRLYTAYIGTREYGRGSGPTSSLRTGAANEINVTLFDLNAVLGFRAIPQSDTTAKRPTETVGARLTWILGSTYLSGLLADNGLVVYPSTISMDAADYRTQRPSNVINDCELASNYFAFVYPDETKAVIASLFFDDANASTAYTTTLRLTNNLADVDNTTTFAVNDDFKLRRVPDDVGDEVILPFANGTVDQTRSATAATYGHRTLIAPNSNVKTSTRANVAALNYLWAHHTEEDRITGTVKIPSQYVNNLRAGQRLQVKFTHLPGYTSWTWVRCLNRAPGQRQAASDFYDMTVELSPQEAAQTVAGIVQTAVMATASGSRTATFPNPVAIGNLLVYIAGKRLPTSSSPGPGAPNTDIALPRWGAGAWTDGTPATTRVEWDSHSSPPDYQEPMKLYYKTADSTSSTCQVDEYTAGVCFEVTGATMAGATLVYKDLQGTATTHAIGSLGTPASGKVALLILGLGADGSAVSLNPGVWIRDLHADGYSNVWASNTNTVGFNMPAAQETWIGHTIATGAALAATLTDTYSHKWGGFAVLLA